MRRAFATAVVSNLGKVSPSQTSATPIEIGGLQVDHLLFFVPIRSGTPISFGVLTHAGELSIGMQYDDAVIQRARAGQLLEFVRARLCSTFSSDPATGQNWHAA